MQIWWMRGIKGLDRNNVFCCYFSDSPGVQHINVQGTSRKLYKILHIVMSEEWNFFAAQNIWGQR